MRESTFDGVGRKVGKRHDRLYGVESFANLIGKKKIECEGDEIEKERFQVALEAFGSGAEAVCHITQGEEDDGHEQAEATFDKA